MKRIFGFDLGIASIGWAVVEMYNENTEADDKMASTGEIKGLGARCFDQAQNAANRRTAREQRRRIRHRAFKMKRIRELFRQNNLIDIPEPSKNESGWLNNFQADGIDIWQLRAVDAFERALEPREFGRILYHLAKHRGYDDITYPIYDKKSENPESKNEDDIKAQGAILENRKLLTENKTMA